MQENPENEQINLLKFYFKIISLVIIISFSITIANFLFVDILYPEPDANIPRSFDILLIVFSQVGTFLLLALILAKRSGDIRQSLRLKWEFPVVWMIPFTLGWLAILTFENTFLIITVHLLPEASGQWLSNQFYEIDLMYRNTFGLWNKNIPGLFVVILAGALTPAVCEELFFRGMMISKSNAIIGKWKTLVITSLLFAVIHFQLISLPMLFIIGFYLGLIVIISNSIYPAIIVHLINNSFAFIWMNYDNSSHLTRIQTHNDLMIAVGLLFVSILTISILYKNFFKSKLSFEH